MLSYKEMCTIGSAMVLISTSFVMGVFYSNLAYDYNILFNPTVSQIDFDNSLHHYQMLHGVGRPLLYILGVIAFVGILGNLIRIYKPNPDLQIFEYASMGLFVFGICIFITNIKTGIDCSVTHNWGEVSENQGLAVIGSSNIILLFVFFAVLLLQAGLWYSNYDYEKRLDAFYNQESQENAKNAEKSSKGKKGKTNEKNDKKKV